MSCFINASFDGKPSETHKQLIEYFKDTPNGLLKANEEYARLTSPEFLKKFHGTKKEHWFKVTSIDGLDRSRFTEQLEPQLFKDVTGKLYYINYDGSRNNVKGKPLAFLSNKAKKELIDNVIFSALGGELDLLSMDFENELSLEVDTVLDSMTDWLESRGATELDKDYIRKEVDKLMSARKMKKADSTDVNRANYDDVNEEQEEVTEDDRDSNEVVRVETFLKNSKDTASANIKFLLSFIPNLKSFTTNADGEIEVKYAENALSEETLTDEDKALGRIIESYKDPHEIWRKLEDNLHDLFTTVDSKGQVVSVLAKMNAKLDAMAKTDPSIAYLKYYLDSDEFGDYKKIQFAQAFHKHYIVFDTTDVSGNEKNFTYKVIDPSVASSKSYKIRQTWNETLQSSPYILKSVNNVTGMVTYDLDKTRIAKNIADLTKIGVELSKQKTAKFNQLGNYIETLNKSLNLIGIDTDLFNEEHYQSMLQTMQLREGSEIEPNKFIKTLLEEVIVAHRVLQSTASGAFVSNKGFSNPLLGSTIYKRLADSLASSSDILGESTVMIAGGKTAWSYSMPSYIDITIAKIKNGIYEFTDTNGNKVTRNRFIEELQASSPVYNHPWLNSLHNKNVAENLNASVFSAFQRKGGSKYGRDNKNILFPDQLADKIFKTLLPRVEPNTKAIFYSPAAADKGRLNSISGFDIFNVDINSSQGKPMVATKGIAAGSAIDVLVNDFISEYLRSKQVYAKSIAGENLNDKVVHYDLKKVDGKFQAVNKDGVPVGNGVQIQILPDLSPYQFKDKKMSELDFMFNETNKELKSLLYSYNGNNVEYLLESFDIDVNGKNVKQLLRDYIAKQLDTKIQDTIKVLLDNNIFQENEKTGVIENLKLDRRLWKNYTDKYSLVENKQEANYSALYNLVADYTLNGMISNTGYNKLFAGDVAYYKDTVDYNKRIPATYTDGKYLMIDKPAELNFNIAVIEGVEISADNLEEMKSNFISSIKEQVKLMDEKTKEIYTDNYINALAESYTDQYKNVNTTDAQAWISLDRWKFLKEKLGEWSPKANEAFKRLKNGTFTYEDIKFAAQPLKGVYFERNTKTGIPTYLKYSQAVLIPSMVKGTQLEYLVDAMKSNKIDEVITLDGVKVGALSPTKIHDDAGNLISDVKLNPHKLSNLNWKLQQQLPVKGMKNVMDVGSQLQKNVISNIFANGQYGSRTGQEVIDDMNRVVSDLTLTAFNETIQTLGLNPEGKIEDKDRFYTTLAKLALDKGVPSFAVEALERQYNLDAIPQLRYKIQNVISALFNNNIAKNNTPGGSFIQISNFGITAQDVNKPNQSGIYMLKDVDKLQRPKFTTGEDGKAKVSSGQVFLPHTFLAKYIPNYQSIPRKELMEMIDKELFKIIGYRIPNQKLSSNQPLEVVGILPPSMSDSIMMYTEITTQTGSDFDIDKTYVMLPAFEVEHSNKKDLVDALFKMEDSKLLGFREDIEDYQAYIAQNPLPTDKINNPGSNKKQLINYLIDRGLIPADLSKKYVKGLRYVKPSKENPNKKQLQNELFEIYYDVLSSPLSYVDMMSGIDGSLLKDEINRLHGKREDLTNLQLIDPTYQLRIKFDNIVGKSGVGLTANQMVDHVYGQISGLTMNDPASLAHIRKYVKVRQDGTIDLSQVFDTEGNKITDSISMFLNAYVDIAKDPYVTKGNFNSYTSNITFFLLRAGMPLKHVISFVGQPILKQLVAEYESTLSSLPSTANKRQTLKESIDNVKRKLNERIDKATLQLSNFAGTENIGNQLATTDTVAGSMKSKSVLDTALLNSSTYEKLLDFLNGDSQLVADRYNANPDGFMQEVKDLQSYLQTQFTSLNNFEILNDSGEQLSEQVLISKADVNGGDHDIATHFTNNNRYNKVINSGVFNGLENKFNPNTMLGSKTLYTMKFFNTLDENLFITMHPLIKPIYPMITKILKGDDYATNAEVVKRVEASLYASMVQVGLRNSPYEITKQDIADLLKEDTGIIARINNAKLNDKYADNALIKALEVIKEEEVTGDVDSQGNETITQKRMLFLSVDNFTRKPETVVDDLSDAWQDLLDSNDDLDNNLAKDLIKYAIFTSGLSKNRHSIFEFMPLEVADYINRGISKLKDTDINDVFNVFIEDFIRHNQNEDFRVSADIKTLTAGVKGIKASDLGLQNIDSRIKFVKKDFSQDDMKKVAKNSVDASEATKFKIQSYKLFKEGKQLMSYIGDIKSLDGTGDIMVIVPTYTLGEKIGNGNIYEYTSSNSTVFKNNQPNNIKAIRDSIKTIKSTFDFAPHSFDLSKTLLHYGKNIQVTEYDPAKAREELIKRNLIKENKC